MTTMPLDRHLRALCSQWHILFESLQNAIGENHSQPSLSFVEAYSTSYRAVLSSLMEDSASDHASTNHTVNSAHDVTLAYLAEVHRLWHLAEIFFFRADTTGRGTGFVVPLLMEWAEENMPGIDDRFEGSTSDPSLRENAQFWTAIQQLIATGRFRRAAYLLARAEPASDRGLHALSELLRGGPLLKDEVEQPTFGAEWREWQDRVQAFYQDVGQHHSNYHVGDVAELLLGSDRALERCFVDQQNAGHAGGSTVWPMILLAKLCLVCPTYRVADLRLDPTPTYGRAEVPRGWELVKLAMGCAGFNNFDINDEVQVYHRYMSFESKPSNTNAMIMAVLDQNAQLVLHCFRQFTFQTQHGGTISLGECLGCHFGDLLRLAGWLKDRESDHTGLASSFVLDYARWLAGRRGWWQAATTYYISCMPRDGEDSQVEQTLSSMLLEAAQGQSWQQVQSVVAHCRIRNLDSTARKVCLAAGRNYQDSGAYAAALYWYIEAEDNSHVTAVCDVILEQYIHNAQADTLNAVVENFRPVMLKFPRLTFLVQYFDFLQLVRSKALDDLKQAGTILVNILTKSSLAPTWFHFHMLLDCLSLLEDQQPIFTAPQTMSLMTRLESMILSHRRGEYAKHVVQAASSAVPEADRLNAVVEPLRLSLSRNLARAFVSADV